METVATEILPQHASLSVLVVDDQTDILNDIRRLAPDNWQIRFVFTLEKALLACEKHRPDVIVQSLNTLDPTSEWIDMYIATIVNIPILLITATDDSELLQLPNGNFIHRSMPKKNPGRFMDLIKKSVNTQKILM